VLDRKWREHLYEMDYLQEGIGLRAMGQRDPLVEYQREGFDLFNAMMEGIKEESVGFLFNLEVQVEEQELAAVATADELDAPKLDDSLLQAAQDEHEAGVSNGHPHGPQIRAKGLDRDTSAKPLVYSSPELGSESPKVQLAAESGGAPAGANSAARRQQSRSNPNRGSRGNRSKRKR
jgi:preprotein translocase subunit SecA